MSATDHFLQANETYAATVGEPLPTPPRLKTTVVTCMDSRLDLFAALGLQLGDVHLIRNAGGMVTDDVLRSLAISQRALGTEEIALIHHTRCGMLDFDDDAFRTQLEAESGQAPPWRVAGFSDVREDTRRAIAAVVACPWLPHRDRVRGFVYDVDTGRLDEVS